MNRNTFIFSMAFEVFFAFAAIGLLFNNVGAIVYLYALLGFSAVLAPFFIRLKKEQDEAKKMKIRRNIALILLLPIIAGVIAIAVVTIALMFAFA